MVPVGIPEKASVRWELVARCSVCHAKALVNGRQLVLDALSRVTSPASIVKQAAPG
jgi:hypothetical protein